MAEGRSGRRSVNGLLLLDKPSGLTSNAALQQVKRLFNATKAGHTGNLDPLATGMLPLCFGQATKFSSYLLNADKSYRLRASLGRRTDTGDADGKVISEGDARAISDDDIRSSWRRFEGDIEQIPPMYSALKHKGKALYKLARQGVEVERAPRQVTIRSIRWLQRQDNDLDFEVCCSKGTYIRTLVDDLGLVLGCGAHVSALRRLAVGPFVDATQMHSFSSLQEHAENKGMAGLDALLLPIEGALMDHPAVHVRDSLAFYLLQGQAVQIPGAPPKGYLRIYQQPDRFLGVGYIQDDGKVAPKRLIQG